MCALVGLPCTVKLNARRQVEVIKPLAVGLGVKVVASARYSKAARRSIHLQWRTGCYEALYVVFAVVLVVSSIF